MKKAIVFSFLILSISFAFAQKQSDNCTKIHQLLDKATTKQFGTESKESIPTDDLAMWKATTTLDGTKRCYIQDAYVSKMYVADYDYAEGNKLDDKLVRRFTEVNKELSICLKNEFSSVQLHTDEYILKATDFNGVGKYANIKINLYIIYNPADKKQTLFMSLMYDPG